MTNKPPNKKLELHLAIQQEPQNALDSLSEATLLSRGAIKDSMQKGAVWITHQGHTKRLRRAKKILQKGDELHLYYNPEILSSSITPPQLISHEQGYSIWYKPYGAYCQGSKWGDHCTIHRWIECYTNQPAFIVHRLDRAARGLIIIGHKKKTTAALAALFEQRAIDKHYQAIIHGKFPATEKPTTVNEPIDDHKAISHVKSIEYKPSTDRTLVSVNIETGRKHQIRRHLSFLGYPIVGDRLYGSAEKVLNLQLCSYKLAFKCPVSGADKHFKLDESLQLSL